MQHTVWFHLYDISRMSKFTETKSRLLLSGIWGKRKMRINCSVGLGFLFGVTKMFWNYILVMISHSVNILKTTELNTLKGWFLRYVDDTSITLLLKQQQQQHREHLKGSRKTFEKIQHLFMMKTFNKLGKKREILNMIKRIYKKRHNQHHT